MVRLLSGFSLLLLLAFGLLAWLAWRPDTAPEPLAPMAHRMHDWIDRAGILTPSSFRPSRPEPGEEAQAAAAPAEPRVPAGSADIVARGTDVPGPVDIPRIDMGQRGLVARVDVSEDGGVTVIDDEPTPPDPANAGVLDPSAVVSEPPGAPGGSDPSTVETAALRREADVGTAAAGDPREEPAVSLETVAAPEAQPTSETVAAPEAQPTPGTGAAPDVERAEEAAPSVADGTLLADAGSQSDQEEAAPRPDDLSGRGAWVAVTDTETGPAGRPARDPEAPAAAATEAGSRIAREDPVSEPVAEPVGELASLEPVPAQDEAGSGDRMADATQPAGTSGLAHRDEASPALVMDDSPGTTGGAGAGAPQPVARASDTDVVAPGTGADLPVDTTADAPPAPAAAQASSQTTGSDSFARRALDSLQEAASRVAEVARQALGGEEAARTEVAESSSEGFEATKEAAPGGGLPDGSAQSSAPVVIAAARRPAVASVEVTTPGDGRPAPLVTEMNDAAPPGPPAAGPSPDEAEALARAATERLIAAATRTTEAEPRDTRVLGMIEDARARGDSGADSLNSEISAENRARLAMVLPPDAPDPVPARTPEGREQARQILDYLDGKVVEFQIGRDRLTENGQRTLDELARLILKHDGTRIVVQGHTDSVGDHSSNLELSGARALAARDYLVGAGVAANRLSVQGFGETRPIASNGSEEGRRRNRRIDFAVSDAR